MKHLYFYFIACSYLAIISVVSSVLLGKILDNGKGKRLALKIFGINLVSIGCLFSYKVATFSNFVIELLMRFGTIWIITISIATVLGAFLLIANYIYGKAKDDTEVLNPSRRSFLRKAAFLPAVGAGVYGGLYEESAIQYNSVQVPTDVKELKQVVLAQISDAHLGYFFSVERLGQVIQQCLNRGANLLVLTGDIFDSDALNKRAIELVNQYEPYFPFGVYFCYGNHEHMRNIKLIRRELAKTNIKVLDNSSIKLFSGNPPVYLLGVDYVEDKSPHSKSRDEFLNKALAGVPKDSYKILLAHHPNFIDDGFRQNINLILTGHTHGGQVMLLGYPILNIFKYMAGPVYNDGKLGYVSRGTGSWFPYRLGCPPEVIFFKFV